MDLLVYLCFEAIEYSKIESFISLPDARVPLNGEKMKVNRQELST